MPPRDRRDLARVLLERAAGDETLVRRVLDDSEIPDAIVGFHALGYFIGLVEAPDIDAPASLAEADVLSPWAVDFRYETESEPSLDRRAALDLVEDLRRWATEEVTR